MDPEDRNPLKSFVAYCCMTCTKRHGDDGEVVDVDWDSAAAQFTDLCPDEARQSLAMLAKFDLEGLAECLGYLAMRWEYRVSGRQDASPEDSM